MVTTTATETRIYNLGRVDQIPLGEGRVFSIPGLLVAVFRPRNGSVYATQAVCTHKGGPLADGILGGEILVCPLHAYRFNIATGQPLGHDCKALRTYPITISEKGEMHLTFVNNQQDGDVKEASFGEPR